MLHDLSEVGVAQELHQPGPRGLAFSFQTLVLNLG